MSPVDLDPVCQCFSIAMPLAKEIIVALTPTMAFLTLSSLMRPTLNRFSINSMLVKPEQYHAMENFLLGLYLKADLIAPYVLIMQRVYYAHCRLYLSWRDRRNGWGIAGGSRFGDCMLMSVACLLVLSSATWIMDV